MRRIRKSKNPEREKNEGKTEEEERSGVEEGRGGRKKGKNTLHLRAKRYEIVSVKKQ